MTESNKIGILTKGLLTVVLLCFCVCSCQRTVANNQQEKTTTILSAEAASPKYISDTLLQAEYLQLQTGDILLRKGFGMISDYIANFLDEAYPVTHCGFIIKTAKGKIQVLHTVSNDAISGMFIESLADYCRQSQAGSLVAVRVKATEAERKAMMQRAHDLVKQKVPFDMAFDDSNSDRLYCAEMMRDIFVEILGQDLLPQRTQKQGIDVLSMDNFLDSTNFELLFNHFDSTDNDAQFD